MEDPTTDFPKRLAMALAGDGRKQGEVAEAAGVPPDQLSRWKTGRARPDLDSVGRLVRALGVSGHWLLTGEGPMERETGADALKLEVIGKIVEGTVSDDVVRRLAATASLVELEAQAAEGARALADLRKLQDALAHQERTSGGGGG